MSMYDASDPRASLNSSTNTAPKKAATEFAAADYIEFHKAPPSETGASFKTWYGRGQNFILSYTEVENSAVLERKNQPDEYTVFFLESDMSVDIQSDKGSAQNLKRTIAFVPPGDSKISISGSGVVIRLFSNKTEDLLSKCSNADAYKTPHPNIPPLEPWPDPPGGFKLRTYDVDVPDVPGRFGRIWRSTNMMVNLLKPADQPRPANRMSPHFHDDFEQCSLTLQGSYVHHLRWPWTTDMGVWRDDDHQLVESPSMTVIPPPSIHTSQAMPPAPCHLIDIFSPPRVDFSEKAGWILNADDYPMP